MPFKGKVGSYSLLLDITEINGWEHMNQVRLTRKTNTISLKCSSPSLL